MFKNYIEYVAHRHMTRIGPIPESMADASLKDISNWEWVTEARLVTTEERLPTGTAWARRYHSYAEAGAEA
jgi:hypothetical protein